MRDYDETFGPKKIGDNYWLGDKMITYKEDEENIYVGKKPFPASVELLSLIFLQEPKVISNLKSDDYSKHFDVFETYRNIMRFSNAIYEDNDPASKKYRGDGKGKKWNLLLKPVWKNITGKYKPPLIKSPIKKSKYSLRSSAKETKPVVQVEDIGETSTDDTSNGGGLRKKKTTIVIPSDPNALLERFGLLMSSKNAGHTGLKNELVSICDELKRQRILNAKSYKKLMSIL